MAYTTQNTPVLGSALGGVREFFAGLATAYTNYAEYRRTLSELNTLSARELEDLGLTRWDIERVAAESVYGK